MILKKDLDMAENAYLSSIKPKWFDYIEVYDTGKPNFIKLIKFNDILVTQDDLAEDWHIISKMETVEEVEQFYLERDAVAEEIKANGTSMTAGEYLKSIGK